MHVFKPKHKYENLGLNSKRIKYIPGWNFFFGLDEADPALLFIDMQWTGRGHPLQVENLCDEKKVWYH